MSASLMQCSGHKIHFSAGTSASCMHASMIYIQSRVPKVQAKSRNLSSIRMNICPSALIQPVQVAGTGLISVQDLVPGGYLILLITVCSGLFWSFWNIIRESPIGPVFWKKNRVWRQPVLAPVILLKTSKNWQFPWTNWYSRTGGYMGRRCLMFSWTVVISEPVSGFFENHPSR